LVEVLAAIVVMSIALLGLGSVLLSSMRMQNKISSGAVARALAERLLERSVRALPGAINEDEFWAGVRSTSSNPWRHGKELVGRTNFEYWVTGESFINEVTGKPFGTDGGAAENNLARLVVRVRWSETDNGYRRGSGKLELVVSRLVNQVP